MGPEKEGKSVFNFSEHPIIEISILLISFVFYKFFHLVLPAHFLFCGTISLVKITGECQKSS